MPYQKIPLFPEVSAISLPVYFYEGSSKALSRLPRGAANLTGRDPPGRLSNPQKEGTSSFTWQLFPSGSRTGIFLLFMMPFFSRSQWLSQFSISTPLTAIDFFKKTKTYLNPQLWFLQLLKPWSAASTTKIAFLPPHPLTTGDHKSANPAIFLCLSVLREMVGREVKKYKNFFPFFLSLVFVFLWGFRDISYELCFQCREREKANIRAG